MPRAFGANGYTYVLAYIQNNTYTRKTSYRVFASNIYFQITTMRYNEGGEKVGSFL